MLLVCYQKCGTCQKAAKWLESRGAAMETRDIKKENPTEGDIKAWRKKSGLPLKKFFNTSGNSYKALWLKEKLAGMSEDDQIKLLAADGMLVKRPILVADDFVLVGFNEEEWEKRMGA